MKKSELEEMSISDILLFFDNHFNGICTNCPLDKEVKNPDTDRGGTVPMCSDMGAEVVGKEQLIKIAVKAGLVEKED